MCLEAFSIASVGNVFSAVRCEYILPLTMNVLTAVQVQAKLLSSQHLSIWHSLPEHSQ